MSEGALAEPPTTARTPAGARLQTIAAVAIAVGVVVTGGLIARFGWRPVGAALATVGLGGFGLFCGYTLLVFGLLGTAWFTLAQGVSVRLWPAFVFARLLREAGSDILPFSQIGGFAMGARAATLLGAPASVAIATSIVDLATELIGQILFTGLGVGLLTYVAPTSFPHHWLDPLLWIGLGVGAAAAATFITLQIADLRFLDRFAARWPGAMRDQLGPVRQQLRSLYRPPTRAIASSLVHFAAWLAAVGGVWIVLRMMHAPLSFPTVVMLESLIYILRSAAFFIPGAIGVVEGGYIVLGPIFGLAPEVALGLSLLKRGRDVALGAPAVVVWQLLEGRRMWRRSSLKPPA